MLPPEPRYRVRCSVGPVPAELLAVEQVLASPRARRLKDGARATVAIVSGGGGELVLKRFRDRTLPGVLEALVLGSRAARVWAGAALLRAADVPTAEMLAVLERRRLGIAVESCVVARRVPGPLLDELWRERHGAARRSLTVAFADYLRRLHAAGLYPQDLRAANIVVPCEQPAVFVLVDLDRVRRYRRLSWRRRRKNLVQILRSVGRGAPRSERLRFLARYLGPVGRERVRRAAAEVLHAGRVKDAEYARRRDESDRLRARVAGGKGTALLDAGGRDASPARACAPLAVGDGQAAGGRHAAADGQAVGGSALPAGPLRERVSCTIICCDEEDSIRDALESVTWCDEIVVVDSFSRDRTLDICREYTDRIYQRPWPGFVEQKAFALAQARHPWVLNLDADERVSPELRREVEEVLRQPRADGFYVPRLVYYLGRWWRRGDWYPDYRLRLFRRDKVVWGGVDPHEKVILRGRSARLHGPLWHYTYRDIGDHLATINRFTGVAARELLLRRRQASVADLLLRPFWRFLRFYALRGGFTQGLAGLFVAQSASFYVFAKYAKLWEATHVRPPGPGGDTGPSPS